MPRRPLVIDIETIGVDWEDIDEDIQTYLLNRSRSPEDRKKVPGRLGLNPGTGRIVAIGMWRPDENKGGVLLEHTGHGPADGGEAPEGFGRWEPFEEDAMVYRHNEAGILQEFWRYLKEGVGTIITFNGRSFDGPYLMIRSAILGVAPTRNLIPYRYSFEEHCDLAEVLSFFRASPLYSLEFWCDRFGIPSPKGDMDGSQVGEAYRQGGHDEIGRYCLQDVQATAALYHKLKPLIAVARQS